MFQTLQELQKSNREQLILKSITPLEEILRELALAKD